MAAQPAHRHTDRLIMQVGLGLLLTFLGVVLIYSNGDDALTGEGGNTALVILGMGLSALGSIFILIGAVGLGVKYGTLAAHESAQPSASRSQQD